jgi:HD-GYP domain-containing protein (c-di-GMP phosphodiesterase class II)
MTEGQQVNKAAMTAKLQALGRNLVLQLHMVLRTMQIHDPSNKALLIATENLKDTINTLWAALGGSIRLQFVEATVYINDLRLRLPPSSAEQVEHLRAAFEKRGLGGLAFSRPVDTSALREFLVLFTRPVETPEDVEALRRSLEDLKELAMSLLDPKQFADGLDDSQLKIDKKTFALQTYAKCIVAAREFVEAVRSGRDPGQGKMHITRIVQDLVDIATERVNFLIKMSAIKSAFQYQYNHAANTCVLSIVLGRSLSVDRLDLVDLGTSALFADLGFALLPPEMLERQIELNDADRLEINQAMIRQIRSVIGKGKLNAAIMRRVVVAYEHHLPLAEQNHVFSRIVSVADAYDALTTKRPWREGFTADEGLRILMQHTGTKYDPLVVKVLVNLMGIYPLGSAVRLASGEIAIVYHNSNDPTLYEKPWVKVMRDAGGAKVKKTMIRNLAEESGPGAEIVGMVQASELGEDAGMAIVL